MTLAAPWKRRSSAAERRQQRAEFQALKAECEAAPSHEMQTLRIKKRGDDQRAKAHDKLKTALAGRSIRPFSALQAARLRPAEHELLKDEVANRLAKLTAEERKAITRNQHLLLACFDTDQLRAVAAVQALGRP
jgi:hypothetical protein